MDCMLERYQALPMSWSGWWFRPSTVPLMAALRTSRWPKSGLHRISRFWSGLDNAAPPYWRSIGSKVWIAPMVHKVIFPNIFHGDWIWNFWHPLLLLLWSSSLPNRMQGRWLETSWLKSFITLRGVNIQDILCMVLIKTFGPAQSVDVFLIDMGLWIAFSMIS